MPPLALQAALCPLPNHYCATGREVLCLQKCLPTPHFPFAVHATVLETLSQHSAGHRAQDVFESQATELL